MHEGMRFRIAISVELFSHFNELAKFLLELRSNFRQPGGE